MFFYHRIQSPVIPIEFDHQGPIGLPNAGREQATRDHIHSVVRTPNGSDYGRDLLRQHTNDTPLRIAVEHTTPRCLPDAGALS